MGAMRHWGKWAPAMRLSAAVIAVVWGIIQILNAYFAFIDPFRMRVVHLTFALVLVYHLFPRRAARDEVQAATTEEPEMGWHDRALNLLAMAAAVVAAMYVYREYNSIVFRIGMPVPLDVVFGVIEVILLLEATRRVVGWMLTLLIAAFIAYAFFGQYLTGLIGHAGYSPARILSAIYMGQDGIWGIVLGVSATFVMVFVLFGAFLQQAGAGQFFADLAQALFGWMRGGAAKMAVVTSALYGTMSGSAVSSVMTNGVFTIPLMKQTGYPAPVAGAIESATSIGAQIMPPVMGAAAFLIAQTLGIPYTAVMKAAILPACLYFFSLLVAVDLQAKKMKLKGLPRDLLPKLWPVLRSGWMLLIPVVILVYLLTVPKVSADFAAVWAVVATVIIGLLNRKARLTPRKMVDAFVEAARATIPVAIVCGVAGVMIGVISLTGLGLKFSTMILAVAHGNLYLTLLTAAAGALILGTGLSTTPTYVVLSVLAAPALVRMGVLPLAAHMFIFYFGVVTDLTPPVAIVTRAAASVAGSNPRDTIWAGFRLGMVSYIAAFAFVLSPALILNGSLSQIVVDGVSACIGTFLLAAALQGIWLVPLHAWERVLLFVGAVLLILPGWSGLAGAVLAAAVLVSQVIGLRAERARGLAAGAQGVGSRAPAQL